MGRGAAEPDIELRVAPKAEMLSRSTLVIVEELTVSAMQAPLTPEQGSGAPPLQPVRPRIEEQTMNDETKIDVKRMPALESQRRPPLVKAYHCSAGPAWLSPGGRALVDP